MNSGQTVFLTVKLINAHLIWPWLSIYILRPSASWQSRNQLYKYRMVSRLKSKRWPEFTNGLQTRPKVSEWQRWEADVPYQYPLCLWRYHSSKVISVLSSFPSIATLNRFSKDTRISLLFVASCSFWYVNHLVPRQPSIDVSLQYKIISCIRWLNPMQGLVRDSDLLCLESWLNQVQPKFDSHSLSIYKSTGQVLSRSH